MSRFASSHGSSLISDVEKRLLDEELEPWTGSSAPGKMRVNVGPAHFSVK